MSKVCYGGLFFLLFLLLQVGYRFHLFYIEQFQLFLFSEEFMCETIMRPGGLSVYLGEFLVQFFYYPIAGSLITAFLLVLIAWMVSLLEKKESDGVKASFLFEGAILLFLLVDVLDFNFIYGGIPAYLFSVLFLIICRSIRNRTIRLLVGSSLTILLFGIVDSIFIVFAATFFLMELKDHGISKGVSFIPLGVALLLLAYLNHTGELLYKEGLFFANSVYTLKDGAGWVIYMPWLLLPASVLLKPGMERLFCRIRNLQLNVGLRLVLFCVAGYFLLAGYDDSKSLPVKQYNYYANRGEWKKILRSCEERKPTDLLCLNYQNLALAEEGVLADSLFMYTQQGSQGLFADWNMTPFMSMTLQKICYSYGDIASACKYAFEGNVCARSVGYPQTLKMLATCNWQSGEYGVAEKYLSYLDKTLAYRGARADTLRNRQSLPASDYFVYRQDMEQLAYDNAHNKKLVDYVLCSYLLDKNLEEFLNAFYYFYKEERRVPLPYQEAILLCARNNPKIMDYFPVEMSLKKRFQEYLSFRGANQVGKEEERKEKIGRYYSGSYWYYYDFNRIHL